LLVFPINWMKIWGSGDVPGARIHLRGGPI
jgi:hypothetical protein